MLKITRTETPGEEKWILQGRLVGLWVSELRRTWKETHRTDDSLKCIVDLNEVTLIDKNGGAPANHVKGGRAIHGYRYLR